MFHEDKSRKYGYRCECISCERSARRRIYNLKKTVDNKSDYKRKNRFPEKVKARKAFYNAVYSGKLKKYPCEKCGSSKAHGHHEDYSKPFDVTWLCPKHHAERHVEIKTLQNAK